MSGADDAAMWTPRAPATNLLVGEQNYPATSGRGTVSVLRANRVVIFLTAQAIYGGLSSLYWSQSCPTRILHPSGRPLSL